MTNMTNTMKAYYDMQQKTMETVLKSAETMPNFLQDIFGTPETLFKSNWMSTKNAKAMYDNNKQFNDAYIRYHQAIVDMMTAMRNNINLMEEYTK